MIRMPHLSGVKVTIFSVLPSPSTGNFDAFLDLLERVPVVAISDLHPGLVQPAMCLRCVKYVVANQTATTYLTQ